MRGLEPVLMAVEDLRKRYETAGIGGETVDHLLRRGT